MHNNCFHSDDTTPYTLEELKRKIQSDGIESLVHSRIEDTILRNLAHQYSEIKYRFQRQLEKLWWQKR